LRTHTEHEEMNPELFNLGTYRVGYTSRSRGI
jgi:hypothetical protein